MKKRGAVVLGLVVLAGCGVGEGNRISSPDGANVARNGVMYGSGHSLPLDTTRTTTTSAGTQEGGGVMFGSGH